MESNNRKNNIKFNFSFFILEEPFLIVIIVLITDYEPTTAGTRHTKYSRTPANVVCNHFFPLNIWNAERFLKKGGGLNFFYFKERGKYCKSHSFS